MAEEEPSEESEQQARWYSNKRVLGAIVSTVCICAAGILFFSPAGREEPKKIEVAPIIEIEDPDGVLDGAMATLAPFTVNLRSEDSFLKIAVVLEFFDFELPLNFDQRESAIRDAVLSVLSKETPESLLSNDGKNDLRAALIKVINSRAQDDFEVVDVYFTHFVVQTS